MVREANGMAAILDADVVGRCRVTAKDESGWLARLAQHRVERLEPALARYGGRLVEQPGDGARAEFPSAAAALGAAIEFQQAMADANRDQAEDGAVVFRLHLHLDDASADRDVARWPDGQGSGQGWEQARQHERAGGIVVSATVRDAVAGRVPASFAELGGARLGTDDQPAHAYEVGWDPADWPAASAAAARPVTPRSDGTPLGRWAGAIVWAALLFGVAWLALAPRPQPASAGWRAPVASFDLAQLERRAEAALARWQARGEPDEPDDEPANPANAPPADAYDGLYAGMATTRLDGRVVTFKLKVTNGIGSGTQSQRECGTAPIALKISPFGNVSGMALMFSSTCLKTELAIRGRALGSTLLLQLGSEYLELSKPND
jgi:class 3 adenylate cyclase